MPSLLVVVPYSRFPSAMIKVVGMGDDEIEELSVLIRSFLAPHVPFSLEMRSLVQRPFSSKISSMYQLQAFFSSTSTSTTTPNLHLRIRKQFPS
mmetsp:Transcript_17329/g.22531  ORF Transcript_17329/g.22531 Transcript_17329/m.22531 type:complete len:94 (+) Transcript_17329:154-435(+)